MNTNKIQQIKNNNNKGCNNQLLANCQLSGHYISKGNAICLNIKNNNTAYISSEYLQHNIFDDIDISQNFKIDILTLIYLGATANKETTTANNYILKKYNFIYKNDYLPTYIIYLKNGIQINIYDNDASSKKFFNILKNYKSSIKSIKFFSIATTNFSHYIECDNFNIYYPPYLKKLYEYQRGIGYSPDSKKTTVKFW